MDSFPLFSSPDEALDLGHLTKPPGLTICGHTGASWSSRSMPGRQSAVNVARRLDNS
jgi:hypothetical protein